MLPFFGSDRVVLFVLFVLVIVAYFYRIDFPLYWHTDEYSKYYQLHTGTYNFRHPQLLLRLTEVIDRLLSIDSVRSVIISGRIISALSIAVASSAFAWFVKNEFGLVFGIITGALVALSPTVFVSGHFFKEDAVLLMGIALTMLALQRYLSEQSLSNSLLVGVSVGLACASKYVGIAMLVPVAIAIFMTRPRPTSIALILISAVAFFCLINYPAFMTGSSLLSGFKYEVGHVATDHNGISWGIESPRTLIHYLKNVSLIALALLIAGTALSYRRLSNADILVLVTPILWLGVVQMSAVSFARYTMPAIALTTVGGVWFGAKMCKGAAHGKRVAVTSLLVIAILVSSVQTSRVVAAITDNARIRTVAWIKANLPADAVIAAEFYTGLPIEARLQNEPSTVPLPQKVMQGTINLASFGSLDKLRAEGVTHVVSSSSSFARYFDPYITLSKDRGVPDREFYRDLLANYNALHVERGWLDSDDVLSSDIYVFDIRK